eukprot:1160988-Pelagomonas_calceolata.AAC.2
MDAQSPSKHTQSLHWCTDAQRKLMHGCAEPKQGYTGPALVHRCTEKVDAWMRRACCGHADEVCNDGSRTFEAA